MDTAATLWTVGKWVLIATALSPMVIGIGWAIVEGAILPRLIPRAEIERLADEMMVSHPDDPEHAALIEEHAAWFRSPSAEQGKWRRVRNAIRRRLA